MTMVPLEKYFDDFLVGDMYRVTSVGFRLPGDVSDV